MEKKTIVIETKMIPEYKRDALYKGSLWNRKMTTYCIVGMESYLQNEVGAWVPAVSFIPVKDDTADITYVMSVEEFTDKHEPI